MALFEKKYKASSDMNVEIQTVWDILVDQNEYHSWNPFTPVIETDWEIGSKVMLTVNMKPGQTPILQTEFLTKLNPPNDLAWGMNWGGFLKAERIQQLTELADGKTLYVTEDVISGILTPIVHMMYGKYIQRGFEQIAIALKKYAESL
jgi:hypothetical protein